MGVISQAPELLECEIGITLFGYPRDNQGITRLVEELGWPKARERLAADAKKIREALPPSAVAGLDPTISLGSRGDRQRAYEAGNIVASAGAGNVRPVRPDSCRVCHRDGRTGGRAGRGAEDHQ